MEDEERIRRIHEDLLDVYEEPERSETADGVEVLVETILSQNTNDINRDKAYRNLQDRYDSWEDVEEAPEDELTDVVRVAGLGPTKAERIQKALQLVREETGGDYSVDFLDEMSTEDAKDWLESLPGVGPKTAAIVLCFHMGRAVFPVDTHVHRLSKRWGMVPENASRRKTHDIMERKVPDDLKYTLHILMIRHGRNDCEARNPTHDTKIRKWCSAYEEK